MSIFSFSGRIGRLEYFLTGIGVFVANSLATYFLNIVASDDPTTALFLVALLSLFLCWISLAQAVKRSHDVGNSGWWCLIPFYGLYLLFKEGDKGKNNYGVRS
ncbi:DUF805 domain-containing protein [Hugenholtzia roseola]|uniref:DUF805 domain-containing protein n=1 Tax=Hugenholtzia roseola TaxID=1002 RepID=UPI0003F92624|nr:DUF805 domain-containing protein [Hugenholtzia roseola]